MSKVLTTLAGVTLLIVFSGLTFEESFAEFATPYNEWDFDFGEIQVYQDSKNLKYMMIKVPVIYSGEWDRGTVTVYAKVTDPMGHTYTHFGDIHDMAFGQTIEKSFKHKMNYDGKYTVDFSMSPPTEPFKDHIFDTERQILEIEKNGRIISLGTVGIDRGTILEYSIENPETIRYDNIVQTDINLPENHNFEKIIVTNDGKIKKEFDASIPSIKIDSRLDDWSKMSISLVEYGNVLPVAGAQNPMVNYISFYVLDADQCINAYCVDIDFEHPQDEFPYWMLVLLGVVAVIPILKNMHTKPQVRTLNQYSQKIEP